MKVFLVFFLLIAQIPLFGQMRLGLDFDMYKPQNRFADNVAEMPLGIAINGIYRIPESRFSVGGDIGVAMYANKTYDYDLAEEGSPGEITRIDEEDCFLHVNAIGRYQLYETELVATYAQFQTGIYTFFSSRVSKDDHRLYDDDTEFHGTSFVTGLGGGVSLNLTHLFGGEGNLNPVFLDFNSSYNTGTRASYRNMGNEDQTVSGLDSGKYRSMVNNINFKVGVSIQL